MQSELAIVNMIALDNAVVRSANTSVTVHTLISRDALAFGFQFDAKKPAASAYRLIVWKIRSFCKPLYRPMVGGLFTRKSRGPRLV